MPMDLRKLVTDLEEVIARHAPETSRVQDMGVGLQCVMEYMVAAHGRGDLDKALDKVEALLETP